VKKNPRVVVVYQWPFLPSTLRVFRSRTGARRFVDKQAWPRTWRVHTRRVTS